MSKATRIRQQNAREKIAAQRAAERRTEQRRRMFITGGSVLAVIVIVVAFIVVKSMNSPTTTPSSAARTPLPASVTKNVTGVPASALANVGKGSVLTYNPVPITKVTGPPLTSNGKPEMLYIGAEYCPYCAAMRWSMAVALSRFGTLFNAAARHSLVQQRRLPEHGHADLLPDRLQQQIPGVHPGRERNDHPFPAAEPHRAAEPGLGPV